MRQLYLVDNPVDRVARNARGAARRRVAARSRSTSSPTAAEAERERVETALGLLASRYRGGSERHRARARRRRLCVPGGAGGGGRVRAAGRAAGRSGVSLRRRSRRSRSSRTSARVSRPEIARIRGVASDSAVAGLADRGARCGGRTRRRGRRDPLPDDAALRAGVRSDEPGRAACARRPGGRRRGPAGAARGGRGPAAAPEPSARPLTARGRSPLPPRG